MFSQEDFPTLGEGAKQTNTSQDKAPVFTPFKKSPGKVDPSLIDRVEGLVNKDFTEDAKKAESKKARNKAKNQRKKARKAEAKKHGSQTQEPRKQDKKPEPVECFVCGFKGIPEKSMEYQGGLFGMSLCSNCESWPPCVSILKKYTGETDSSQCKDWMMKASYRGTRQHRIKTISEWITKDIWLWPHQYPQEVQDADIFNERWESLFYWSVWIKEERFVDESVAWYSDTHGKIMVGKVSVVKKDTCKVYREPENDEEKELGNFFEKELKTSYLLPPLSQTASLLMIRKAKSRHPDTVPFKCCGPCNRVRISMRSDKDKWDKGWSGPNKSPWGGPGSSLGLFCKDCYDTEQIYEKDGNMQQALQNYSEGWEHRAFGGVYVTNWPGKPGKTFRTCSCYKCTCAADPKNHTQTYTCEDCGFIGDQCTGYFDRRSSTHGLPCTWENEDHWFCKKCWCRDYWHTGKWNHQENGSVWFKKTAVKWEEALRKKEQAESEMVIENGAIREDLRQHS
mgnify:CR=1 FL=1